MPEMNSLPAMKSLKDTSTVTGLPYKLLRELCIQKKVKFIRSGTKYYINMGSLADYLNEGDKDES